MGKSASERGQQLVVNRNDYLHALTLRALRIGGLIELYAQNTDLSSAGMTLLKRCYAAAQDDLSKEG